MGSLGQDLRYGLRKLAQAPGFAIIAVLTLGLGIGANTAIFSLIDGVLLRSLPVREPNQLVILQWKAHRSPMSEGSFEYSSFGDCGESGISGPSGCSFPLPIFRRIRSQTNAFAGVTAFAGPAALDLSGNGPASVVKGEIVSGDCFSTLGVNAAIGRTLGPGDDSPSASPAAVLSYAYWQSAFGGSPSVLGRTILLNNVPFTIVGVAERSFTNLSPGKTQDLWLPIMMVPRLGINWGSKIEGLTNWWLLVLARVKPGVSLAQAQTEASLVFRNEVLYGPRPLSKPSDDPEILLTRAPEGLVGQRGQLSKLLYVLMCAVGIILVIACANVAGLLLSRATARQEEMAVRLAIGAGRATILRQLLTESVLLSLVGGSLGIAFAYWGVHAITALMTGSSSGTFPYVIAPDWRVLAFTLGICILTGIAFGLAPAFRSTHVDLASALKENASTSRGGALRAGRFHLGGALVVAQVALSVLVLIGAGLLVRTLERLRNVDPGFDARNVLVFEINPGRLGYKAVQIENLFRELRDRLVALPGVISVSYSSAAPLSGGRWTQTVHIEGQPHERAPDVDMFAAGPGFFGMMRIPLVEGRMFTSADFEEAARAGEAEKPAKRSANSRTPRALTSPAPVATAPAPLVSVLVNRAFVRRYFANRDPLGKRITRGGSSGSSGGAWTTTLHSRDWQIVGVVGDTKYDQPRRKIQPIIYLPFTSAYGGYFELRTAADPHALIPAVRSVAQKIDANLPLSKVITERRQIEELMARERLIARVSGFFGVVALVLACIGLYGLLSNEVSRRTREIGIRIALGAQSTGVIRLVVGQGLELAITGAVIGTGTAFAVTRFLSSFLFGVRASDPATFAAVITLIVTVAVAACLVPARRALRIDPVRALHYE